MAKFQGVPFNRPTLGVEDEQAVIKVLRSGWIVGGTQLVEFEEAVARRCGARFAVGVSSWTTGAFLVLRSWGIGSGDEVIVPSLTFIATVNAIRHTGAMPVFVDVDERTWNIDPALIEDKITSRTSAIMPVDQLGLPSDLEAISAICSRRGLRLLDDAACALGSRIGDRPVGAFGDAAVFSFHARKVVTTGEGGMIVTNDSGLADRLRRLRHQGMSASDFARHDAPPTAFETYDEIGYNFRMTDIQAALGVAQLSRLDEFVARRTAVAQRYSLSLEDNPLIEPPFIPPGVTPNWQSYQVALRGPTSRRNDLMAYLYNRGINVRRGVMASHLEPAHSDVRSVLPITERAAARTLQLPLYPQLTLHEQDRVLEAIDEFTR